MQKNLQLNYRFIEVIVEKHKLLKTLYLKCTVLYNNLVFLELSSADLLLSHLDQITSGLIFPTSFMPIRVKTVLTVSASTQRYHLSVFVWIKLLVRYTNRNKCVCTHVWETFFENYDICIRDLNLWRKDPIDQLLPIIL